MYKVFNQKRTILFTENLTISQQSANDVIVEINDTDDPLRSYSRFLKHENRKKLVLLCRDHVEKVFQKFSSGFKRIDAAGGLVKNPKDELLMIYRLEKWDLPKGKIEKNEEIKIAAMRECEEETGIEHLKIVKELSPTYHIYTLKNKTVLKKTYWFEMLAGHNSVLVPQTEEDIEEVKWMNRDDVKTALENTYDSLKELIIQHYLNA